MKTIIQDGKGNQGSLGDNSPNQSHIRASYNFNTTKKIGWFTGGIITSLIAGIIIEICKSGETSTLINYLINLFKK